MQKDKLLKTQKTAKRKIANVFSKPSSIVAEKSVVTLIKWAGDNPKREGLLETPQRVINSYQEFFAGYLMNPDEILSKTFEEVEGYDEMVIVKDIRVESHCEHHMVPILGSAHVAYIPNKRIVGLSKLARVVDVYSKRLQVQEKMTAQIAETIDRALKPRGVAVVIEAAHQCMSTRGTHKTETTTVTSQMIGVFQKNEKTRAEFMNLIRS